MSNRQRTAKGWADQPIHLALINAMRDIQEIGKDSVNTESENQFRFRGIDTVMNAVGPVFRKHGILPLPKLIKASYRDVRVGNGHGSECVVEVEYRFYGPQGDYLGVTTSGQSIDYGDKGAAKAQSVAYRTAILQMFAVPTGDPDPDASSYRREAQPPAPGDQLVTPENQQDRRFQQWQDLRVKRESLGWSQEDAANDFRRWSGGLEITGPIEQTTQSLLTRYKHQMGSGADMFESDDARARYEQSQVTVPADSAEASSGD